MGEAMSYYGQKMRVIQKRRGPLRRWFDPLFGLDRRATGKPHQVDGWPELEPGSSLIGTRLDDTRPFTPQRMRDVLQRELDKTNELDKQKDIE